MNQVAEALSTSLEGRSFNKLILYEKAKYEELENNIAINDMTQFSKEEYKIPIIPDFVPEDS
jgi:hypothetical protein